LKEVCDSAGTGNVTAVRLFGGNFSLFVLIWLPDLPKVCAGVYDYG